MENPQLVFSNSAYPYCMAYDSEFSARLKYIPFEKNKPTEYSGTVKINIDTYTEFEINLPKRFKQKTNENFYSSYVGRNINISEENPLFIEVHAKENRLKRKPEHFPIYKDMPQANKVLESLKIKKFNKNNFIKVLDWMRETLDYETPIVSSDPDFTVEQKNGNCESFSRLLDYFVRKIGGISEPITRGYPVFNRIVDGKPVFRSIGVNETGNHAWNEVYYDNKWNIVDPTIYIRSPDELKMRAINKIKDVYYFYTPQIFITLPDSKQIRSGKKEDIVEIKQSKEARLTECAISYPSA